MTAPYASDPAHTRGRLVPEEESAFRSPWQRDRDRIIHSSAFRRLKHKTQVFVEHEGDYFRTRLTHSIEVAQVARTIAGALGLNAELTEAVALAHDLGHTPFGHAGEDTLDALMQPYGGFDHNAQAVRIVTALERHYAEFDGLNLTWETLEGLAKHNGPVTGPLPYVLANYNARHDLELHTNASAEAQVAALADDIAYNNHDLHDGLRRGGPALSGSRPQTPPSRGAAPGLRGDGRGCDRAVARDADGGAACIRRRCAASGPTGDPLFARALVRPATDPCLSVHPHVSCARCQ